MNDRQHYVFLDCSKESTERTITGDQYLSWDNTWQDCFADQPARAYHHVRRPVTANPSAQPTDEFTREYQQIPIEIARTTCPTCGKPVEIVNMKASKV